jgi:uncharacterized protein (DUF433 family)
MRVAHRLPIFKTEGGVYDVYLQTDDIAVRADGDAISGVEVYQFLNGKPCIRGMGITVYDILSYLAARMSPEHIPEDFPYLAEEDIQPGLSYAADGERQMLVLYRDPAAGFITLY